MSDPSPSPPHQPPQHQESLLPDPTPNPTPTPTRTPTPTPTQLDDQNPQNQQTLQLVVDQQDPQQQQQQQQGMGSSLTVLPSSIDLPAPIRDTHVSNTDIITLTSPTPTLRRIPSKRKKGKPNIKKQQAIEKRYQTLIEKLNPIPFMPSKILDFTKHENLFKRLGLWDFVHIEFDKNIRVDLIARLVATYDPKSRRGYVNDRSILVNRSDLARALKLPVKKDKAGGGNVVLDGLEIDSAEELMDEDSIGFIEDFVSNWVLLHEDTWMMPSEVLNWTRVIQDGHPEKVDWAGLFWFMVEKELTKGEQLGDCYYASHLQYLIKSQREDVLLWGEPEKVEADVEEKEEDDAGNEDDSKVGGENEGQEDGVVFEGPNVELTLGQDDGEKEEEVIVKKDGVKDVEMMDVEEGTEVEEDEEQGQWLFDGKNKVNDHFLQRCNMEESRGLFNYEGRKEDDEEIEEDGGEEEAEDGFDVVPNDNTLEGEGLTGNLLQSLETTHIAFSSQEQHHQQSSMGLLASGCDMQHANNAGPSFYHNSDKREIEHEHSMSHHSLNDSNKRLRIDGPWDNKPTDFGACMEQMHQLMTRAKMIYEAKEEQSNMNQQILLNELQRRDSMIDHLHKAKCEDIQKRDEEIFRLERELYVMGNLVEGYRKALKETQKAFGEYRQCCQLPEEPIYRDAGPGGVMLSTAEIERQRLKQEEEQRLNCLMLVQKAKEVEEDHTSQFAAFLDKVHLLDKRLMGVENEMKQQLRDNRKGSEAEQLNCKGSEAEQLNDNSSEAKQLHDNGSEAEQLNDNGSEAEQLIDNSSEAEQLNDNGSEAEQLNDNGSEAEQLNHNGSEVEQINHKGSEVEQLNHKGSEAEQQASENPECPTNE